MHIIIEQPIIDFGGHNFAVVDREFISILKMALKARTLNTFIKQFIQMINNKEILNFTFSIIHDSVQIRQVSPINDKALPPIILVKSLFKQNQKTYSHEK